MTIGGYRGRGVLRRTLFILALFLVVDVSATKDFPVSINNLIQNSDGIIIGEFKSNSYKKNKEGDIVTQSFFEIEQEVGLDRSKPINRKSFSVGHPGGYWQGLSFIDSNYPEFVEGEKSLLFLKKSGAGYELLYGSLGYFRYHESLNEDKRKSYITSYRFPEHPKLKKVDLFNLENMIYRKFSSGLKGVTVSRYAQGVKKQKPNRGRAIASIKPGPAEGGEEDDNKNAYFLVFIFIILGLFSVYRARKN